MEPPPPPPPPEKFSFKWRRTGRGLPHVRNECFCSSKGFKLLFQLISFSFIFPGNPDEERSESIADGVSHMMDLSTLTLDIQSERHSDTRAIIIIIRDPMMPSAQLFAWTATTMGAPIKHDADLSRSAIRKKIAFTLARSGAFLNILRIFS
jgi:hypothetical protein